MSEPTVIGSWITLLASALDSYGINARRFLASRGIDLDRAMNPATRIPIHTMSHLWGDAASLTGDQAFGLKAGSLVTPNTLSALGMALWSACTIKDQLECFIRYLHVLADASHMSLEERDGVLVSITRLIPGDRSSHLLSECSQDVACALMHTLRRTLYKRDFSPVLVQLARSKPENPQVYETFFGCPVEFGQPEIRVHIAMADATAPIPGGSSYLAEASLRVLDEFTAHISSKNDLLWQLRQALVSLLPQGKATVEQVANHLQTSKRTLHRQLDEQGTSFREELEAFRRERAFRLISQGDHSLGDISFMLGFSSSSNFTRAFKRWTGEAPQTYRQRMG